MGMGTGMGMVDRKWEGNGIVVWNKFSLVALITFSALYFSTGYHDLTGELASGIFLENAS